MSVGRFSTSPTAPSASWVRISTTVRRKFGSTRSGEATSSRPRVEMGTPPSSRRCPTPIDRARSATGATLGRDRYGPGVTAGAATTGDGDAPVYPPDRHILRDLAFTTEMGATDAARGWLDVGPFLRNADGVTHAGAVATLVDALGGGLAAIAALPDWMATADLTLHLLARRDVAAIEARARVARAGPDHDRGGGRPRRRRRAPRPRDDDLRGAPRARPGTR